MKSRKLSARWSRLTRVLVPAVVMAATAMVVAPASGANAAAAVFTDDLMKPPRGQGIWPAFWMLGEDIGSDGWPNCGELDIMENVGFEPNTVHGTIHGPGYPGSGGVGAAYNGPKFSDDFHTYAMDWAPNKISWYVDGNLYQTRTPADLNGNGWVFDHPFFLILNLAVGGYWPGDPDGGTQFPQQFVIDYVRVTA